MEPVLSWDFTNVLHSSQQYNLLVQCYSSSAISQGHFPNSPIVPAFILLEIVSDGVYRCLQKRVNSFTQVKWITPLTLPWSGNLLITPSTSLVHWSIEGKKEAEHIFYARGKAGTLL